MHVTPYGHYGQAPTETPSHAALRFLRGHKFTIKTALDAFNTHIEWRCDGWGNACLYMCVLFMYACHNDISSVIW